VVFARGKCPDWVTPLFIVNFVEPVLADKEVVNE